MDYYLTMMIQFNIQINLVLLKLFNQINLNWSNYFKFQVENYQMWFCQVRLALGDNHS
jgi:hypothetical protein